MRKLILMFLVGLYQIAAIAQGDDQALRAIRANNTMTQFSEGNSNLNSTGLYGMTPSSSGKVLGDPYWDVHFGVSSVELKGRKELVEGNYVRYDIYSDELEFLMKDGIKVLPGNKIVSVVWQDSVFSRPRFLIRGSQYKEKGVPLTGFLEILVDDEIKLLKRIFLSVKKPTYNQALDVGSKNSKILKEEEYYIAVDNSLTKLKSKKDIGEALPKYKAKTEAFIKNNKVKFNTENDLIALIEYCNTLKGI